MMASLMPTGSSSESVPSMSMLTTRSAALLTEGSESFSVLSMIMRTLASVELVRLRETSAARTSRLLPSSTESPDTLAVPSASVALSFRSREESSTAS